MMGKGFKRMSPEGANALVIPPIEQMHSFHIVERQEFFRRRAVDIYVRRRCDELEKGNYGDVYPARFLAMPKDVLTNPVRYLKRGDHLRRTVMCGIGFHDGIYLGDGRVAHLSPGASGSLFEKRDASARIDSLTDFAQDKQIVIVEHCIRRRLSADIADTAEEHCRQKLWHGQYDLSLQNCQHFAYMCACGSERMSPANRIMAAVVNAFPISLHS